MDRPTTLIDVRDLSVSFGAPGSDHVVRAVDGVCFTIPRGGTLGLVGESGSGKTTVGRAILRTVNVESGTVRFEATDLTELDRKALRVFRRDHMQLIFQDPYASLNPRMTVRDIIAEPLECQGYGSRSQIDARVREVAAKCRLNVEYLRRFPHAFSGGQRQRICIARALAANPEFVVCDEAVSALDVSIQADVINLLMDLQAELGLTYLFIAHDLSVVAQISTQVAVMYVGKLVELAPTSALFDAPMHPYTRALLSAVPVPDPAHDLAGSVVPLSGDLPSPMNPPSGCVFRTRCPRAQAACAEQVPALLGQDHRTACHFPGPLTDAEIARARNTEAA